MTVINSKLYRLPSIGDYNTARAIYSRTYDGLEKWFLKCIMYAYMRSEPLHPGIFKNLARLREKYLINKESEANNG